MQLARNRNVEANLGKKATGTGSLQAEGQKWDMGRGKRNRSAWKLKGSSAQRCSRGLGSLAQSQRNDWRGRNDSSIPRQRLRASSHRSGARPRPSSWLVLHLSFSKVGRRSSCQVLSERTGPRGIARGQCQVGKRGARCWWCKDSLCPRAAGRGLQVVLRPGARRDWGYELGSRDRGGERFPGLGLRATTDECNSRA